MNWQGWFTLAVLAVTIIAMAREVTSPDVVLTWRGFVRRAVRPLGFPKRLRPWKRKSRGLDSVVSMK